MYIVLRRATARQHLDGKAEHGVAGHTRPTFRTILASLGEILVVFFKRRGLKDTRLESPNAGAGEPRLPT